MYNQINLIRETNLNTMYDLYMGIYKKPATQVVYGIVWPTLPHNFESLEFRSPNPHTSIHSAFGTYCKSSL